jgi:glycosyltransferase involved in cell wall biosynthesis
MASQALICAHGNEFNRAVLGDDGYYFKNSNEVTLLCNTVKRNDEINQEFVSNNLKKIETEFSWAEIVRRYIAHFKAICRPGMLDVKTGFKVANLLDSKDRDNIALH